MTWWLTYARERVRCTSCGESIPAFAPYAYEHSSRDALCGVCQDNVGVIATPSKRMRKWKRPSSPPDVASRHSNGKPTGIDQARLTGEQVPCPDCGLDSPVRMYGDGYRVAYCRDCRLGWGPAIKTDKRVRS